MISRIRSREREDLLTSKEVAAQLKVTPKMVLKLIKSGELRATRIGRIILVSQFELTAFLDKHKA
ncbi:MAG TPA: helix-turn-helix domain-containing protein [Gammaproteobacteria bacterium]|jgi:excisionase family DNA binding protein|nr:helix-turn-helix domain-containing protein [Gammaproteobacteria bacterium]HZC03617.1 helix-turn-helix domain-containing protein [Gammaproteobacteria bacterium]